MTKKKNYLFGPEAKRIIHIVLYVIFLIYSIYLISSAPDIAVKVTYATITIVFLGIACWAEYLEFLYQKAIKTLNYACNPEKALCIFESLLKKDFFRSYKNSKIIFDVLCALSTYNGNSVINLIEQNDKIFRSSIDQLLIRNTCVFLAYVELDNKTQAKKAYPEIAKLKNTKVKGKKIAPLYNWVELEALYYMVSNDYKKALTLYEQVNPTYMNNREKTQYLYYYAKVLIQNKQTDKAKEKLQECLSISNKLEVTNLAISLRKDIYES